jgi:hypothetical protein
MPGCQGEPRLGIPHAHHERRHAGATAFIAASQALAVDGDHARSRIKSEPFAHRRDETSESLRHLVGIKQPEYAAEAVVARCPMVKVDDLGQRGFVGGSKIRDVDARLGAAQSRRQGNEQHCRKVMLRIEVTRITNFTENRNECFHPGSPESGKPSSESTFSNNATVLLICDSPGNPRGHSYYLRLPDHASPVGLI